MSNYAHMEDNARYYQRRAAEESRLAQRELALCCRGEGRSTIRHHQENAAAYTNWAMVTLTMLLAIRAMDRRPA